MAKVEIYNGDSGTGIAATVDNRGDTEQSGLVVATRPFKVFENAAGFFSNETNGIDLGQNASFGGTPVEVHNGIDNTYWTASSIVGTKYTFDSTDVANSGTRSIKTNNGSLNDTMQLDRGSDLDMTGYTAVTLFIYTSTGWGIGDTISLYGYDTGLGVQIGDKVDLGSYFNIGETATWHKVTIPLTDMGSVATSTTLDSFRISIDTKVGASPLFYIDDMQIEETGTPIAFTVEPAKGQWLYIDEFKLSFAVAYSPVLADSTMPKIPYDSFFGITPANGIVYQRSISSVVQFSVVIRTLMDLLQISGTEVSSFGSDGTNSWATVKVPNAEPLVLKYEQEDFLSFTISDDLSGFGLLRFGYNGRTEDRSQTT